VGLRSEERQYYARIHNMGIRESVNGKKIESESNVIRQANPISIEETSLERNCEYTYVYRNTIFGK
jgi:hypothetical protein